MINYKTLVKTIYPNAKLQQTDTVFGACIWITVHKSKYDGRLIAEHTYDRKFSKTEYSRHIWKLAYENIQNELIKKFEK